MLKSLLFLLIGVTLACPAWAQHEGPGAWIPANPAYVNAEGTHCCGLTHCQPPKTGDLMRLPGGWMHIPTMTVLPIGTVGIYPSEEAQMFACVWGGKLQCVFEATGG